MSEKEIGLIHTQHADGTEERESAHYRLRVVGPNQLRPITDPLTEGENVQILELTEAAPEADPPAGGAGLSPTESSQPAGAASEEPLPEAA